MTSFGVLIQDDTSCIDTMVTWAALRTIHIVCKLTIHLTVENLGISTSSTEDTNTVSCINRFNVFTSVDARWTTKHDCGFSYLVGRKVFNLSAVICYIFSNDTIS